MKRDIRISGSFAERGFGDPRRELIIGVRPNSLVTTTRVWSGRPRSSRSLTSGANGWSASLLIVLFRACSITAKKVDQLFGYCCNGS